jgi:hypothetical protein
MYLSASPCGSTAALAPPPGGCYCAWHRSHYRERGLARRAREVRRCHAACGLSSLPSTHLYLRRQGLTRAFSGAASGIAGNHENCAARPPLQPLVRRCSRCPLSFYVAPVFGCHKATQVADVFCRNDAINRQRLRRQNHVTIQLFWISRRHATSSGFRP